MPEIDLKDQGKQLVDKIPDLSFDWYARLIPGALGLVFFKLYYNIGTDVFFGNLWLSLIGAYLVGHLFQPFSSGILTLFSKKFRKKKEPIVSKAYAELIGFMTLILITVSPFLVDKICIELGYLDLMKSTNRNLIFIFLPFYLLAVVLRLVAFFEKFKNQENVANVDIKETSIQVIKYELSESLNDDLKQKISEAATSAITSEIKSILESHLKNQQIGSSGKKI